MYRLACPLLLVALLGAAPAARGGDAPAKVTSVEGVTEYALPNGFRLLLMPEPSKPTLTVNMVVRVGSRHEGYGEAGMAHLLEHMLCKGTPTRPDIQKELTTRGARNNATTNSDRTNYFETLPASDDNLDFALRLEADRLLNCYLKREQLLTEMSVVRLPGGTGCGACFFLLMVYSFGPLGGPANAATCGNPHAAPAPSPAGRRSVDSPSTPLRFSSRGRPPCHEAGPH